MPHSNKEIRDAGAIYRRELTPQPTSPRFEFDSITCTLRQVQVKDKMSRECSMYGEKINAYGILV
jgi:hypothetical protein